MWQVVLLYFLLFAVPLIGGSIMSIRAGHSSGVTDRTKFTPLLVTELEDVILQETQLDIEEQEDLVNRIRSLSNRERERMVFEINEDELYPYIDCCYDMTEWKIAKYNALVRKLDEIRRMRREEWRPDYSQTVTIEETLRRAEQRQKLTRKHLEQRIGRQKKEKLEGSECENCLWINPDDANYCIKCGIQIKEE